MDIIESMIGRKFGKYTVVRFAGFDAARHKLVECQCSCGRIRCIKGTSLRKGRTTQCRSCASSGKSPNHEYLNHYLCHYLRRIKQYCYNISHFKYPFYGARGIKICDEWIYRGTGMKSFVEYVEGTIGLRPDNPADWSFKQPCFKLARINTNEDYKPGNLQWVHYKDNPKYRRERKKNRK